MSWSDTTLSCELGNQEEIKTLIVISVFDKCRVKTSAWRWILGLMATVINKHALIYSLINNDQSDLWRIRSLEHPVKDGSELFNLIIHTMSALLLAQSVTVDNDLIWVSSIDNLKLFKSIVVDSIQISFDNFLTFSLADDVLVETGAIQVS